ncbi:MAG: tRNA (adenosine(37)-N6)-threonylcarbamoyltransferase complex ATPase subunit type 1 TsaE [Candidatus Obscuribacterales bacterium]|nr:tRNA (adenosine(37)-N6)-threonylcarbamoyltransferase complex ATPase subunit type 1 TsaE [Candidatus Obscuribacterales bacterium]
MEQFVIKSREDTERLGGLLASEIENKVLVLLKGELGAGKTTLVQSVGIGLGIDDPITSPTFTILNEYECGRIPLIHIDLYRVGDSIARLGGSDLSLDLFVLEFEELLETDSLIMIEWPEFFIVDGANYLEGLDRLEVKIERISDSQATLLDDQCNDRGDARKLSLTSIGPRSEEFLARVSCRFEAEMA